MLVPGFSPLKNKGCVPGFWEEFLFTGGLMVVWAKLLRFVCFIVLGYPRSGLTRAKWKELILFKKPLGCRVRFYYRSTLSEAR